ncbi:PAS domain S-box protein [Microvirga sp. STR05]|uniref:histidine kinase n=1 Tax=Hymenobacter duratus TaxID=2771356 RepID=A0ABR8JEA8_9BACT|nr:PAS domain-containing sensor histidine kinase [Hymenobacter duratus]MBD2715185.1 PAS domain-containing sensor histidine kinase [Hymenobacter duratus]MBR7950092.1 PAS domain S-box protein [Microvirga sp. STR05]
MPSSRPPSSAEFSTLEAENRALREEIARLKAQPAAELAQKQERFRTVFENSPLGQKIITPDLVIRQANQALATMLGFERGQDLVGRRILEFAHPDHAPDWQKLQERLWAHKEPSFTLETCLVRQNGSSFWCRITSVLFPDDGAELGYTTLEDIAERKDLEVAHKRLYDAQETILHLAAHDLQSPINNLQMLIELLRLEPAVQAAPESSRQPLQELLTMMDRSCQDANVLLKDVLYLGQMESSRLEKHRTDLGAYLDERLILFRVAAQEKGVELVLDLPSEPIHANIHADKFGRILDNLLTNSFKFTPAGGTIHVRLQRHEGHVRLTVQDTGLGISENLQPHVFDKFTAASRPGLYGDTTTGLGLFITKQIVELHEGKIWLESQEHQGTTFFIDLS